MMILADINMIDNPIVLAKNELGSFSAISRACQVSRVTVTRWHQQGRLPRTDYTGETDYWKKIRNAANGALTKEQLLPCYSAK